MKTKFSGTLAEVNKGLDAMIDQRFTSENNFSAQQGMDERYIADMTREIAKKTGEKLMIND